MSRNSCSDTDDSDRGFGDFLSFLSTPNLDEAPKQLPKDVDDAPKPTSMMKVGNEKALETTDLEAGDIQASGTTPDPFLLKAFQDTDINGDGHLSRDELKVG